MMKDYRRMMEQVTLSDRKKEEIMDMLENKDTQTRKRRMTPVTKILLVAALAVGCVLSIAAGLPYQMYNFFSGGSMTVIPADGEVIGGGSMTVSNKGSNPLVLEDGRLWFINGEERTDVTDLIDEDTPYIYEHTDPTTGNKGYVILGGTVDDFGWVEYADLDGGAGMMGENFAKYYVTLNGERFLWTDLTSDQLKQINEAGDIPSETIYSAWLVTAMNQLGYELD